MTDFVLMTYREIATALGLAGPDSARMRVKRQGWRIVTGNHPRDTVHVEVPQNALSERSRRSETKRLPVIPVAESDVIEGLRAHVTTLKIQTERDRAALEAMRAERDAAQAAQIASEAEAKATNTKLIDTTARASRAEGELAGLKQRSWLGRILG